MVTKVIAIAILVFTALHRSARRRGARQLLYESRCVGCRSVDHNRIGPMHRGVVGRKAEQCEGYDYSPALKASKIVWNVTLLQNGSPIRRH